MTTKQITLAWLLILASLITFNLALMFLWVLLEN